MNFGHLNFGYFWISVTFEFWSLLNFGHFWISVTFEFRSLLNFGHIWISVTFEFRSGLEGFRTVGNNQTLNVGWMGWDWISLTSLTTRSAYGDKNWKPPLTLNSIHTSGDVLQECFDVLGEAKLRWCSNLQEELPVKKWFWMQINIPNTFMPEIFQHCLVVFVMKRRRGGFDLLHLVSSL